MRRIFLVICAVSLLASVLTASPAKAATYTPASSTTFNNPRGPKAKQLAIITQIDRAIDASPRGSTIKMAQYLFDIDSTANKLVAAHRRGVNVQILIDDGNATSQSARVKKALGTDRRRTSFVTTCKRGCMSDIASVMHAKFYLFSAAGSARLVSMISSANPYTGNTFTSWNNLHTIVGDARIFGSLSRYFNDMILDRTTKNYFRTTTSGKYKLYLFPRAAQKGVQVVVPLDVLNHVTCSGAAKGYGSNGKTVIRVAMWGWTYGRLDLAKKLWELHNRGCRVQVILNSGRTNPRVIAALLKRSSRYGVIGVYDAWKDKNHNGLPEVYVHHKLLAINGKWFGHADTKVSYTGSQNFTAPATLSNNDIVLRIKDNRVYNDYAANLDYIRTHYTKKITRAPSTKISAADRTAGDRAGKGAEARGRATEHAGAGTPNSEDEFDPVTDR
jgi:phosphatidylserine/phosphatidylglycerophosphate/cardiolipin synthase-like enzyme